MDYIQILNGTKTRRSHGWKLILTSLIPPNTRCLQHDTNNSKLVLLLFAVFTTATTVAMSTTTTATVAVTAATIPVATAVVLERCRRDRKVAAFMAVFAAVAVYQYYYASNFSKTPQHTSGHNGRRLQAVILCI
jgi:hypothetical protein